MKNSLSISVLLLLSLSILALAQTPATVRERYGPPDEKGRYAVRDGITLEATFGPGGYPLAMSIKPIDSSPVTGAARKVRANPKTMDKNAALEILEELVPSNTRGKETASFSESHGCTSIHHKTHERIIISIVNRCEAQGGGTYAVHIQWRQRP